MALGLKGCIKNNGYTSLKWKLKSLKWELKYAWQRVWRGWDDRDMFNMDISFIEREKEILQSYRKNHSLLFNVPQEYQDVFNKIIFTETETNIIIDMMIYHLEMMNEDHVEKVLYGKNIYDDDYDIKDYNFEKAKKIAAIMEQNKNAFMKLFSLFFWQLWD